MNILLRILCGAAALSIVLALGMYADEDQPVAANPMKANQQQYDRIHEASKFYVNSGR
ncbi:hypothetical protein GCM10023310_11860 [Paenibacillus vulneris]|uniref:Uncharacterized protein n=1 Tax=Paenibacillus vulneris TaxID=1133364 RepID=A0ABW3UIG5_9BACL|nr:MULTISPECIES: hypothetical protein [unclassified Paenibacillus]MBE1441401.1 hypothetical protein [Paenibacillus sp. OAS669]